MPEISIIVPVYNVEKYLDDCISSIVRQDYRDFELILVDDGSTDHSIDVCRKWELQDSRIVILKKGNGGVSDARNAGLDIAKGNYISFVDADDYVTEDYLSYLLVLFKLSDKCAITVCNRQYLKNGVPRQKFNYVSDDGIVWDQKTVYKKALYSQISHGVWARLYKREVFRQLRFPTKMLHEDTYILGYLIEQSEEIVFGNKVCYWYVVHDGSIVHSNDLHRLKELVESTRRLAEQAEEFDPSLHNAAVSKIAHAEQSALSLLERDTKEAKDLAKKWKEDILRNKTVIMKEKQNLKRDKLGAIILSCFGLPGYSMAFKVYEKLFRSV